MKMMRGGSRSLTKAAIKFALAINPAIPVELGKAYSNQSVAEIIELKGKSKASPRHENEKIPMKTNLPPPIVSLTILSTAATALLL